MKKSRPAVNTWDYLVTNYLNLRKGRKLCKVVKQVPFNVVNRSDLHCVVIQSPDHLHNGYQNRLSSGHIQTGVTLTLNNLLPFFFGGGGCF